MTAGAPRAGARSLNWRWRLGLSLFALVAAFVFLQRCSFVNSGGVGRVWWSEKLQLHDGSSATISRYTRFEYWNDWFETGSSGRKVLESRISFDWPRRHLPPWQAELVPLLFDIDEKGRPILITTTFSCETWRKLNGPPHSYWTFSVIDDRWQETALPESFAGRKPNLLFHYSFKDNWLYLPAFIVERRKEQQFVPALFKPLRTIDPKFRSPC